MKLINKIIFSIVCFSVSISSFSQESTDKKKGLNAAKHIENTIQEKISKSSDANIVLDDSSECPEKFEAGGFPPFGWAVLDNGVGTAESWKITSDPTRTYGGVGNSAIIDREDIGTGNTSQDWLITSRITVPESGQLRFFTRQTMIGNNGSIYEIRISTNATQNNKPAYTTVKSWTESTLNTTYNIYEEKRVDLPYTPGTQIYIAFVRINTQPSTAITGDRWLIDNVKVIKKCEGLTFIQAEDFHAGVTTDTTAKLSWSNNSSATQWEVEIVPAGTPPTGTGILTSNNPYTATGLTPGTSYNFYVRAVCSSCEAKNSDWSTAASFDTAPTGFCVTPSNVEVTNYTGTTATLSWTQNSGVTSWEVVAFPYGSSNPGSGTIVTQNSYIITGLNPNIVYFYSVRAICGSNNFSSWINAMGPSCTLTNPNTQTVKNLFKALVNKLISLDPATITNGFTCPELDALAPYISDPNPAIYNFEVNSNELKFSFSNHVNAVREDIDLLYGGALGSPNIHNIGLMTDFDTSGYISPQYYLDYVGIFFEYVEFKGYIKHIDFCPPVIYCTPTNPKTPAVKNLFKALVNKLLVLDPATIVDGYTCPELTALAPYITEANPAIYHFEIDESANQIRFSFAPHDETEDVVFQFSQPMVEDVSQLSVMTGFEVGTYTSSSIYTSGAVHFAGDDVSGVSSVNLNVRHINFCPSASCTTTNPMSPRVNKLFVKLVQKLISMKLSGTTDANMNGISIQELTDLSSYITPDQNPGIYNFTSYLNSSNQLMGIAFSFLANETEHDVLIGGWQNSFVTANNYLFDLSDYTDSSVNLNIIANNFNNILVKNIEVKHINFCPQEICVNHVALVVDESGSIDVYEKAKIKRQLRKFLKKQADLNDANPNWNMYVSLIGMSDSDVDNRTDHVLYKRVSNLDSSLSDFTKWLDGPTTPNVLQGQGYGNRYDLVSHPGVSGGSDYWKSGLDKALSLAVPPKLVVMITDGSETAIPFTAPDNLKTTMAKFDNHSRHVGPLETGKPHLYVIGIDNGFYVYDDSGASRQLPRNQDPNYVPSLRSSSLTGRVTPALVLSLKYLLQLQNNDFPINTNNHPDTPPNFSTDDYIGLANMDIIGDPESTFLSDNMDDVYVACGSTAVKDPCDDCFSFQPKPGKPYVINAWVKEELNVQVKEYANPKITLRFRDANKELIEPIVENSSPYIFVETPAGISFKPKGDIIEGWQRIGAKFEIPENTVYMEFELVNESNSVPVFFDDIRIYPIKGSMKSFVYDPETFKLMSELDENNYATYYEYDNEGGLVRIKKETVKGIKTIQETRSGNVIKVE